MSYVIAAPEMMAATATDLATIGSNLSVAHLTAAAPTVAVTPAAADEVSASIAHLFSGYALLNRPAAAISSNEVLAKPRSANNAVASSRIAVHVASE